MNAIGSLDGCPAQHRKSYMGSYVVALLIGGILKGLLFGFVGLLLDWIVPFAAYRVIAVMLILLVFVVLELRGTTNILPAANFAVPASWVSQADRSAATFWGIVLGLGFLTYQAGTLFFAYSMVSVLSGNIYASIAAGILYSIGRCVPTFDANIRMKMVAYADTIVNGQSVLTIIRRYVAVVVLMISVLLLCYAAFAA